MLTSADGDVWFWQGRNKKKHTGRILRLYESVRQIQRRFVQFLKQEITQLQERLYSKELIEGIEIAANIFGVNPYKLYTIDELVGAVMNEYFEYVRQHNGEISGGVFEK